MDIIFKKTCDSCPEQYDAFLGDRMVGYLRLRWSHLTVTCPDTCCDLVYEAEIGDSGWDGCFEDETQRQFHLEKAKEAINSWILENPERK